MKAFIFDPLWNELVTDELLSNLKASGLELMVTEKIAPLSECKALFEGEEERILCLNPDYVDWKLSNNDYKNIPNLKGIFGAATSTSWIDKTHADAKDIPICNIRNFSTEAVAEWAIMMMLNVARQTPRIIKDGFPLDFNVDYMKYRGIELYGKKVGILGLGNIGSAIAKRCAGLGMDVCYWSRSSKQNNYKFLELEKLFVECDVIFPTIAHNNETDMMLQDDLMRSMKKSAILISVVHKLFNQELVADMVKNGELFGFGFEASPASFDKYEGNVWAAPAYAWAADSTMNNSMEKWVENMVNAANGKFPNKVN